MKLSQETLAKRSATKKAQREARAKQFIEEHGEYLQDARVMSYGDLMVKYKISYDFCKALEDIYCIQKDERAVESRRAEKFSKSMHESGIEQRKKTVQERYGVKTPLQLSRVRELSDEARLEAIRLAAEERLNDFIESAPDFAIDFQQMTIAQLADKYHITESYCAKVLKYLGLSKTKEELDAHQHDVHLALRDQEGYYEKRQEIGKKNVAKFEQARKERIQRFLDDNPTFVDDFKVLPCEDVVSRYGITGWFYKLLQQALDLTQDKVVIKEVGILKYKEAMRNGGLAKARQTMLERYGVESPYQLPETRAKCAAACQTPEAVAKREASLMAHYGVRYSLELVTEGKIISETNKHFAERLEKHGVHAEFEKHIGRYSFDLAIGDKLLIEINPTISHSLTASYAELAGIRSGDKPIERSYHFKKWKLARENGFELLSLFDWTSKKKFLDFVLSKCGVNQKTVGARKFKLLEIPKQRFKEVNTFLDENHVLGACRGTKLCYALVDDDAKLYSVMTFGKPRYRTDCDFELLRFASLVGFSIPGAASKLFKRFADEHKGARVITYSDNNLGNGRVYKSLGFEEVGQTGPADVWCSLNGTAYVKDVSLIMQGADRLLGGLVEGYFPVGLDRADFIRRGGFEEYAQEYAEHEDEKDTWWPSNQDIMRHYGFVQVADCGATIWVYDSEKIAI